MMAKMKINIEEIASIYLRINIEQWLMMEFRGSVGTLNTG
jgi:hypothetical protein